MRQDSKTQAGTVHHLWVESAALKGNLIGEPTRRRIDVYVPAGHDGRGLPLLVDLVGFTGGGPSHTNWKAFGENLPERCDRLIASGEMKPAVVALPDCFTCLGGNQYIDSAAMGDWAKFLLQDAVPEVERQFGCGGLGQRGVFGKSSGGYGAIVHALLYSDFWSAAACHSGDMDFPLTYLAEMPKVLRALSKAGGTPETWMKTFFAKQRKPDSDVQTLMMLCMCATYDPDPAAFMGVRLPVDPHTCEVIAERWSNWMAWDPLTLAETHHGNLKRLKGLFIDCGDVDQFDLVYGARRLHRALERLDVAHVYEEFPDDHSSVDYRMDRSLPFLANALAS